MFCDLQEHNLQYQQLTDESNTTQKRIIAIQEQIKQAKQAMQWQQSRLNTLVHQEALSSTALLTSTSPSDVIHKLQEQVKEIQKRLCERRTEYVTLCSNSVSHLQDIMTQQLAYCNQVLEDARANNPLHLLSGCGADPNRVTEPICGTTPGMAQSTPLLDSAQPSSPPSAPNPIKMELDQLMADPTTSASLLLDLPAVLHDHPIDPNLGGNIYNPSRNKSHHSSQPNNLDGGDGGSLNKTDRDAVASLNILEALAKPPSQAQLRTFQHLNISQLQLLYDKLYKSLQHIIVPAESSVPEIITHYHLRVNRLTEQLEAKRAQSHATARKPNLNFALTMKKLGSEEEALDGQIELYQRKIVAAQRSVDCKNQCLAQMFGTQAPPLLGQPQNQTPAKGGGNEESVEDADPFQDDHKLVVPPPLPQSTRQTQTQRLFSKGSQIRGGAPPLPQLKQAFKK